VPDAAGVHHPIERRARSRDRASTSATAATTSASPRRPTASTCLKSSSPSARTRCGRCCSTCPARSPAAACRTQGGPGADADGDWYYMAFVVILPGRGGCRSWLGHTGRPDGLAAAADGQRPAGGAPTPTPNGPAASRRGRARPASTGSRTRRSAREWGVDHKPGQHQVDGRQRPAGCRPPA
jgi:hypothetical protein